MSNQSGAEDAAWVTISLPLSAQALHDFTRNGERLLRINPCLEFDRLERTAAGALSICGRNESNGQPFDTAVGIVADPNGQGLALRYGSGIKRETRFDIESVTNGSVLRITEVYATPALNEREQRLPEVDRSLLPWAAALRRFLLRRARWGGVPGYTWLVERFWLGMRPRERRIAWLIVWTTLLEFVVFVAVLAVYLAALD